MLLAMAVDENRLAPVGRDVWLGATAADADPRHLLSGIARAFGLEPGNDEVELVTAIHDVVWAEAPNDVALIIDDAHFLESLSSRDALQRLLDGMPANGHMVISGRSMPSLSIARLRAHGQVLTIGEGELELDDDELGELLRRGFENADPPRASVHELTRHAATADLQLAAGVDVSRDFLWEEVLSAIDEDRLRQLTRCAVLDELDDELVDAMSDGAFTAAELVRGVPLIETHDDGERRLHSLLREALLTRLSPGEHRKALAVAGDIERARERYEQAVHLSVAAGDEIAVRDAAREFVIQPNLRQQMEAVHSIRRVMHDIEPESAITLALDASARYGDQGHPAVAVFERCAAAARLVDDHTLEALALHRVLQSCWIDKVDAPLDTLGRLGELAEVDSFARGALAHANSTLLQYQGRATEAMAVLDDYRYLGRGTEMVMRSERLCDLGRPEMVGSGLTPDDLASLPAGAEIFVSFAMWLRGDAMPEFAEAFVADMVPTVLRRGMAHVSVSLLGVATSIALAAGELATARRRLAQARDLAATGVPELVERHLVVAQASVAAVDLGDAAAADILAPIEVDARWPTRPYLLAIPLFYLVRPDTRAMFDRCELGWSLTAAVSAGQVLAGIREGGDARTVAADAARLPWSHVELMRVHLLPHHLAEVACAAVIGGSDAAAVMLDQVPDRATQLRRVQRESAPWVAAHAKRLVAAAPAIPSHRIATRVLGPIELERDGEMVVSSDWLRRGRVRELWAFLLERRRATRFDVVAAMWPEHGDDNKAMSNLRAALSLLQRVLEPEREPDTDPFFLRVEAEHLSVDEQLRTDADEFDELVAAARAHDDAGLPGQALITYRRALALYRGDYLDGLDAAWAVLTRVRLRSLAVAAACRIAELVAAKGDPEDSARLARRAQQIDPDSERAGRLLALALDAAGDRVAARRAAVHLRERLDQLELRPSRETQRLFTRLQ